MVLGVQNSTSAKKVEKREKSRITEKSRKVEFFTQVKKKVEYF